MFFGVYTLASARQVRVVAGAASRLGEKACGQEAHGRNHHRRQAETLAFEATF